MAARKKTNAAKTKNNAPQADRPKRAARQAPQSSKHGTAHRSTAPRAAPAKTAKSSRPTRAPAREGSPPTSELVNALDAQQKAR